MIYWRQVEEPGPIVVQNLIAGVVEYRRSTGELGCECQSLGMSVFMTVYQEVEEMLTIGSEFQQFVFPKRISTIQCLSPGDPKATAYDLLISRECQGVALNWVIGEGIKEATHNILWWAVQQKDAYWNADLKKYFPNWFEGLHSGLVDSSDANVSVEGRSHFNQQEQGSFLMSCAVMLINADPGNPGWDGPGWYFGDETGGLLGPFSTKEDAAKSQKNYDPNTCGYKTPWLQDPKLVILKERIQIGKNHGGKNILTTIEEAEAFLSLKDQVHQLVTLLDLDISSGVDPMVAITAEIHRLFDIRKGRT